MIRVRFELTEGIKVDGRIGKAGPVDSATRLSFGEKRMSKVTRDASERGQHPRVQGLSTTLTRRTVVPDSRHGTL